jgi:hypothetical protein
MGVLTIFGRPAHVWGGASRYLYLIRTRRDRGGPVADRTQLDSNFISLVLSVSGRVRPIDLHGMPESERTGALHAFYDANASASMPLHFEGDDLVAGVGSGPAPSAAPPASAPAADLPTEPFVSDYAPASAPTPAADVAEPLAPPAALEPLAADAPAVADSDFFAIPPSAGPADPAAEHMAPDIPVGEMQFPAEKVSFLFWLLPVFFTWVGGIIAFFLVRKKNPKTAKAMLITGIAITVIFALAGVAVVAFGLLALPGLS